MFFILKRENFLSLIVLLTYRKICVKSLQSAIFISLDLSHMFVEILIIESVEKALFLFFDVRNF